MFTYSYWLKLSYKLKLINRLILSIEFVLICLANAFVIKEIEGASLSVLQSCTFHTHNDWNNDGPDWILSGNDLPGRR